MPSRDLKCVYHLDANRINARQMDPFVNQLERWNAAGVISLEMAYAAYVEAGYGSFARRKKADDYTWISTNDTIGGELEFRRKIETVLFSGRARNQNQKNDVLILFAAKYAGATLVTADGRSKAQPGGILGNAHALKELGIRVLSARDAVAEIKDLIHDRDQSVHEVSARTGIRSPWWVGRDDPELSLKPL